MHGLVIRWQSGSYADDKIIIMKTHVSCLTQISRISELWTHPGPRGFGYVNGVPLYCTWLLPFLYYLQLLRYFYVWHNWYFANIQYHSLLLLVNLHCLWFLLYLSALFCNSLWAVFIWHIAYFCWKNFYEPFNYGTALMQVYTCKCINLHSTREVLTSKKCIKQLHSQVILITCKYA